MSIAWKLVRMHLIKETIALAFSTFRTSLVTFVRAILLPALALPSAGTALVFLLFYSLGTMLAMSAVTSLIGEASMRVSETLSAPNFPARLSMASSLLAVLVGVAWTSRAIWRMRSPLS